MSDVSTEVAMQFDWHAMKDDEVLQTLESSVEGLSDIEVNKRLQQYGPNRLRAGKGRGPLARFASQFHNMLIYVLLAAGVLTAVLQHWIDAGVIAAVVLINAIIGFIQEGKAEQSLAAIRQLLSSTAAVRRDEQWVDVSTEQLVPGDIVALQPGDKVPADLRLFKVKNLQIDEAMLTGESVPTTKNSSSVEREQPLGDRHGMAYSGTLVTYGQGRGVVVATADRTEIGRISEMLAHVQPLSTPLLRQMAQFGRRLTAGILSVGVLTVIFGVLVHDYPLGEMLLAAVGLSVAAIPEGLPAIMTITLAIGVQRMARRHAIIRRLPAVETLGALTIICSDKTGTLTRNEMTVQAIATGENTVEVSGVGYQPSGEFLFEDQPIKVGDYPVLKELCRATLLCNDASLNKDTHMGGDSWSIQGDPTEAALLTLAVKGGMDLKYENEAFPRGDIIPFESEHRFMATLHHDHSGHGFVYVKGAPERILALCNRQRIGGEDQTLNLPYWHQQMEAFARRGLRLLAIAAKPMPQGRRELNFEDIDGDLSMLGIIGLIDPPRAEAIQAVRQCHAAGIRVKMITGDHALTAVAIANQLGIGDGSSVLTGADIDSLSAEQLNTKVIEIDVFARTSPEHKLNLVKALQANHHICSMTGDGVNDAPALRRADVGVSMGRKGTEVAKEASEMVLTDDNFASIVHAVEEGRTVYDNLKKAILFMLPTNGGEALTIVAAILLGSALPITAAQILWVNMITAVTLALAFAFEPAERGVMSRPPRLPSDAILSGYLLWRVIFVSLIIVTGTFGVFIWLRESGVSIEYARTAAVNSLVMFEIFYLFNARHIASSSFNRDAFFGNHYAWLAIAVLLVFQMAFTYAPPMQRLFSTEALSLFSWAVILPISVSVFFLVELEKWVQCRLIAGLSHEPITIHTHEEA